MDVTLEDNRRKKKAAIYTAILMLLLLLFMWLMRAWVKYDPPLLPQGAYIEFGWTEGDGNTESETPQVNQVPQEEVVSQSQSATSPQESESLVTDDNSDIEVEQNEESSKSESTAEKEEVVEEEQTSDEWNNADKNVWNTPTEGDGEKDDVEGNKGKPEGDKNSKGELGSGPGAFGEGAERYVGNSIRVIEKPREAGEIVLDIYVDRKGNFLRAEYNMRESTSTSNYLINLAKKSAERTARFHADNTASIEQKISVRFIFKLN